MPVAQKITHFFCWTCREYHEKRHPHFLTQKSRLARRKAARAKAEDQQKRDADKK